MFRINSARLRMSSRLVEAVCTSVEIVSGCSGVAERFFRAGETGHESEYFFELVGGNKCWRRVAGAEYGSLHGAIPLVLKERVRF